LILETPPTLLLEVALTIGARPEAACHLLTLVLADHPAA
jgi:hypothetical protein